MTAPGFQIDLAWVQSQFPTLSNLGNPLMGGQKVVFPATHSVHGPVVLKIMRSVTQVVEIEREILAAATVNSPLVPKVFDHGQAATPIGPCLWLIEAKVEGEVVRTILGRGPMPFSEVARMGTDLLATIGIAATASIVHRDIKPDNIIRAADGHYWLLDFGLARHLTLTSLTATGQPFGKMTPGYAPVEQCRNIKPDIDSRADLFAIGMTMHECLTGSNPLRAGARDEMEIIQRTGATPMPDLPASVGIRLLPELNDFIKTMTQRRRDLRPPNVADAAQWLADIVAREANSGP